MELKQLMDSNDVNRVLTRISHEILEKNQGSKGLYLVGLETGGVFLSQVIRSKITEIENEEVLIGSLDVSMYRDDLKFRPQKPKKDSNLGNIDDKIVVLVDDVLFTGRTVRAALQALNDFGRPISVQLAIMVDRGHRELPIRPDFVGKNIPTNRYEIVVVNDGGVYLGIKNND